MRRTIPDVRRAGNAVVLNFDAIDTSHRPFLEAIAASPDDDLPRLVYADWQEENGHRERADLIRVQCHPGGERVPAGEPRVERVLPDLMLQHLPARNPVVLAARYLATFSPPGHPTRLRWSCGELFEFSGGRYSPANKSRLRVTITGWLCREVERIHHAELRAWEIGGSRGRRPTVRNVSMTLVGQVLREVVSHVYCPHPRVDSGPANSSDPAGHGDPDSWHFDLFGWDDSIGVGRPAPASRLSRSHSIEARPGTAFPDHFRFVRGFVSCGDFVWPRPWSLKEVAAAFARQPVTAVRLLHPDVNVARRKGTRWVVVRGEQRGPGQWQRGRPEPWFADGVIPAAAFDILAGQSDWDRWDGVRTREIGYTSLGVANFAVRKLEQDINAAIRTAMSPDRSRTRS